MLLINLSQFCLFDFWSTTYCDGDRVDKSEFTVPLGIPNQHYSYSCETMPSCIMILSRYPSRMCEAQCEEAQSKFSLRLPQSFQSCQNQDKLSASSTHRQTLSDDKPQFCRPHESTVSHSLGNHPFVRSDNFAGVTL